MSESMSEPGGSEPAYAPYLRFARNVLVVDLVMGVGVFALSWWQGWTSVEESTTAIFGGGAVLLGLAVLPFAGPVLEGLNRGQGGFGGHLVYEHYADATPDTLRRMARDQRSPKQAGITLTLLAAGAIPVAYAGVVSLLVL